MPIYQYKCPACGWQGERIVNIAARDEQLCEANRFKSVGDEEDARTRATLDTLTASTDGAPAVTFSPSCGAALVREEIALNAKMGHRWTP